MLSIDDSAAVLSGCIEIRTRVLSGILERLMQSHYIATTWRSRTVRVTEQLVIMPLDQGATRSGIRQSGIRQSGIRQSGIRQSGIRQSGIRQSGIRRSGIRRSGIRRSGIRRSGREPKFLLTNSAYMWGETMFTFFSYGENNFFAKSGHGSITLPPPPNTPLRRLLIIRKWSTLTTACIHNP